VRNETKTDVSVHVRRPGEPQFRDELVVKPHGTIHAVGPFV